MIIQCESCSRKFVVKDSNIPKEGRTVQCGYCSVTWHQMPITISTKIAKQTNIKKPVVKVDEGLSVDAIKASDGKTYKFLGSQWAQLLPSGKTGLFAKKKIGKELDKLTGRKRESIVEKKAKNEHSTEFKEFCDGINTVIIDEVHMAKADVLKRLLTGPFAHCGIRWGLTGTVPKAEFEFMGIKVSIGDVIKKLPAKELQDKGVLANCYVNVLQTQDHPMFKNYQEELKWLTTDSNRTTWIAQTIKDISLSGNTLILVDRISAGEILQKKLKGSVFISGSTKTLERKEHYDEVSTTQNKIIIATYGVASVGINIPRIFNLVLIEPGKSFVRVIQSIGRGIRKAEDKDNVQIWDITSSCKFAKRHLTQRKKFYKEANYPYNIEKIDYENPYTGK